MFSEANFTLRDGVLYWPNGRVAGGLGTHGYIQVGWRGRRYLAHRIIYWLVHGIMPKMIDHVDGNKLNNLPGNLRAANNSVNQQNLRGPRSHNTHGLLGVSGRRGRYRAKITVSGRRIELGLFDTPEAASAAYQQAKAELHVQAEDRPL